jgi:hypothetical protein
MHGPINVKSPNNIRKWQMGFNTAFKGLIAAIYFQSFGAVQVKGFVVYFKYPLAGKSI